MNFHISVFPSKDVPGCSGAVHGYHCRLLDGVPFHLGRVKGLEEFGSCWFIHAGCFRQWSNPGSASVWMVVENVRGCKQRWIIIGQGLGLLTAQQVWCCGVLCCWVSFKDCTLRSIGLHGCCFLLSFQCNVGASSRNIHGSWSVLQIYALKCLADLLCKSRQAHATLCFKFMAWKSFFKSHCKLPYPWLCCVVSASSSDPTDNHTNNIWENGLLMTIPS